MRLGLWPEDLRVGAPPAETSQMVRLYRPSLSLQATVTATHPKAVSSTRGQPGPGAVAEATDTEEIPGDFGLRMGRGDHPVGTTPTWRAAYGQHTNTDGIGPTGGSVGGIIGLHGFGGSIPILTLIVQASPRIDLGIWLLWAS